MVQLIYTLYILIDFSRFGKGISSVMCRADTFFCALAAGSPLYAMSCTTCVVKGPTARGSRGCMALCVVCSTPADVISAGYSVCAICFVAAFGCGSC